MTEPKDIIIGIGLSVLGGITGWALVWFLYGKRAIEKTLRELRRFDK